MLRDPVMHHLLLAVFTDHSPTFEELKRPVCLCLKGWMEGNSDTDRPLSEEEREKAKDCLVQRITDLCIIGDRALLTEFSREVGKNHAAAIYQYRKMGRRMISQGTDFLKAHDRMLGPKFKDKREAAKRQFAADFRTCKEKLCMGSSTLPSSASAPTVPSNASVASTAQRTSGGTEAATSVAGTLPITELILSNEEFRQLLDHLTLGTTGGASTRGSSGQGRPAPTS